MTTKNVATDVEQKPPMLASRPMHARGTRTRLLIAGCMVLLGSARATGAEPQPDSTGHSLAPVICWAEDVLKDVEKVEDYTALLVKRERIGDSLAEYQSMRIKIRHKPFSVYLKFTKPTDVAGREVLYVEGRNQGMLLAHDTSLAGEIVGTLSLPPRGLLAMHGQRYPVTMIGFKNLATRLVAEARQEAKLTAQCDVKWFRDAKVDGRPAVCVEVSHPIQRPGQQFALARVCVDKQLRVPVRYEGYLWSEESEGAPWLVEEYTFSEIELNVGLTDEDFDPANPQYDLD